MKYNKGFTLFELLVSISIIGILMALATASYSNAQKKGRDARRMQDLKTIQNAAEIYYSTSGTYSYPTTASSWTAGGNLILPKFPTDPKTNTVYTLTSIGGAGANGTNYCSCATIEDSRMANSDANCNNFGNPGTGSLIYCVRSQQ